MCHHTQLNSAFLRNFYVLGRQSKDHKILRTYRYFPSELVDPKSEPMNGGVKVYFCFTGGETKVYGWTFTVVLCSFVLTFRDATRIII